MLLALLLFFVTFLNYLDRQALAVVAPVMRGELGLSLGDYAQAVSAFPVAYTLICASSGIVLDRTGYRAGLALFVALWSAFCCLHMVIAGFAHLIAFRFLLGLVATGGLTGAVKTVVRRFDATQGALTTGLVIAGAGVGSMIAAPLIVSLTVHFGWRVAFLIVGVAGLIRVPLWFPAARDREESAQPTVLEETSRGFANVFSVLRDRRVRAYAIARFLGDGLAYFFVYGVPEYLVTFKHFSFAMLGFVRWIPFFGSCVGAIRGGYVSGRLVQSGRQSLFCRKTMMTAAAVCLAIRALLQASSAGWQVLLSLSFCTFGMGMWASNGHSIPGDGFSQQVVATVHGLGGSAGALGGILLTTLVGCVSQRDAYLTIFSIMAVLQPLGVVALWLWVRDAYGAGNEEPDSIHNISVVQT